MYEEYSNVECKIYSNHRNKIVFLLFSSNLDFLSL